MGGATGPLSQLRDRGSPPTGVAGPRRAAPYKGGGGHEEQYPVSPTRPTSLPTDQGSCERREAPPPPPVVTALHRGSPWHCTATTNSISTDEFILYYLYPTVTLSDPSPSTSRAFLWFITRTPCFIYTVESFTHRSTPS
jgi:hypothetical protein